MIASFSIKTNLFGIRELDTIIQKEADQIKDRELKSIDRKLLKENWQKNDTILTLKAQMQEKKNQQRMEGLIKQNDFKRSIEFINTNKLLNQREEDVRKSTVAQYKELLDKQVAYNQKAKMYGNMSQVEKKLNHIELSAFKNYDNLNYALIPGINSNKEWSNPYQNRSKNKTEVNTRLNKSGMSRDIQAIIFNKPIKLDSSIIDIKKVKIMRI